METYGIETPIKGQLHQSKGKVKNFVKQEVRKTIAMMEAETHRDTLFRRAKEIYESYEN